MRRVNLCDILPRLFTKRNGGIKPPFHYLADLLPTRLLAHYPEALPMDS